MRASCSGTRRARSRAQPSGDGRFELADSGTLFLDEIGEIPPSTGEAAARAGRESSPASAERPRSRSMSESSRRRIVRCARAWNRGRFRADLYYRLNVLSIYLPPLRERPADIPLLVRRFIKEFSAQHDRKFHGISAEAMQILMTYPWPGNVRELRNLIESMVVLAPGREIGPEDIPRAIREGGAARFLPVYTGRGCVALSRRGTRLEFLVRSMLELRLQVEELRRRLDEGQRDQREWVGEVQPALPSGNFAGGIEPPDQPAAPSTLTLSPGMTMADIERAAIEAALRDTRGNRRKAAEILDIGERTLYRKRAATRMAIATSKATTPPRRGGGAAWPYSPDWSSGISAS